MISAYRPAWFYSSTVCLYASGQERLEQEMRSGQEGLEKVRSGQEGMKSQIQAHVESQVDEIKIHVHGCIGKTEEEIQCAKLKIEEVENEVQRKIKGVEENVQEKISNFERRIKELEERPNYFPASQEFMSSRPTLKPLTFDGRTSWTVFKTQLDVVSSTNGWTDFLKASQLVASLRGSAAEVLQGIPADKLTDLDSGANVTLLRLLFLLKSIKASS
ncbi:hypothetical protein AVEN_233037-1 [Araneus ventricosus]|uniref:Uncharacterized protein n=1 Tax=Araneus ventricosus TaxID=182803 RepID=A0A4Y2KNA3_ARAVE|nr:hypothetical protein AVEN_233037-1 [Araneus ventricosus]